MVICCIVFMRMIFVLFRLCPGYVLFEISISWIIIIQVIYFIVLFWDVQRWTWSQKEPLLNSHLSLVVLCCEISILEFDYIVMFQIEWFGFLLLCPIRNCHCQVFEVSKHFKYHAYPFSWIFFSCYFDILNYEFTCKNHIFNDKNSESSMLFMSNKIGLDVIVIKGFLLLSFLRCLLFELVVMLQLHSRICMCNCSSNWVIRGCIIVPCLGLPTWFILIRVSKPSSVLNIVKRVPRQSPSQG